MSATPTNEITRIVWDAENKVWYVYTGLWRKRVVEAVTMTSDPVRWGELSLIVDGMTMHLCGTEQVWTPKRGKK